MTEQDDTRDYRPQDYIVVRNSMVVGTDMPAKAVYDLDSVMDVSEMLELLMEAVQSGHMVAVDEICDWINQAAWANNTVQKHQQEKESA